MREPLEQIAFEVTYRCDIRCNFCYNCWKAVDYPKERELTPEEYDHLLQALPDANMLAITGGEPLIRDDLMDIAQIFRDRSRYVSLITNGTHIDDMMAAKMADLDLIVQLPVHGLGPTHDEITGVPGTFKRLVGAFSSLKQHRVRTVTSTVVTKDSIDDLEGILEFAISMGSRSILLIRFLPGGQGQERWDLLPSQQDVERAYDILDRVCDYYGVSGSVGVPNLPCLIDESRFKHINFNYCRAGWDWFVVDPSGRMRICNHSPTVYGDLMSQPLEEILQHPTLQALERKEVYPVECGGCDDLADCRGGCRAVAETMYGNLYGPDPLMRVDRA